MKRSKKSIAAISFGMAVVLATPIANTTVYAANSSTKTVSTSTSTRATTQTYKTRDPFFSLKDTSVNRMESEHFQIIWGNEDTTGTVNEEFVRGNLENLEMIRSFYIDVLGMKDIGTSMTGSSSVKYKTNLYISNTGLGDVVEDDWAYMSVDAGGFGYMCLMPGAMRVDEPSWVIPHELAHVFTYHQGGVVQEGWYEATANWFRDQYLGSTYYRYGNNVYGPTSDFFQPYIMNSQYYFPHLKNWYDAWPILLYISENPDQVDGLGMECMHKLLENTQEDDTIFTTIERCSGVSIKEILGGMTRRLVTMDFSRQEYYLNYLNELLQDSDNYNKIYTTPVKSGSYYAVTGEAPMQGGYNIIPLSVDLTKNQIEVTLESTSTAKGADFRASIVTKNGKNETNYSDMISTGTTSIKLKGDETAAYLVVCATPDTMEDLYIYDENKTSTRYTYRFKVAATNQTTKEDTTTGTEETKPGTEETKPSTEETTSYVHNFTTDNLSSDFFDISGKTASSKKVKVDYNGLTLTTYLKMESKTKIGFTLDQKSTLTMVFCEGRNGSVKIDGKKVNFKNGVLTVDLSKGTHTITKGSSEKVFYMSVAEK